MGIAAVLELDLRTGDPESEDNPVLSPYPFGELSGSGAFYIAMDSDYDRETDPKMLRFDGISLTQTEDGKTLFRAPIPNTATVDWFNFRIPSSPKSSPVLINCSFISITIPFCLSFEKSAAESENSAADLNSAPAILYFLFLIHS